MGVVRQYECAGHGVWETDSRIVSACPAGCTQFQRVFMQAPGYIGQRTKNTDRMQGAIARNFGLTDMSNRNGDSVMTNQQKRYPKGTKSFALPATELSKPGEKNGSKKQLNLAQAIAGSNAFEMNAPGGIVHNPFQTAQAAIAGSRRSLTTVAAACDGDGRVIKPR